MIVLTGKLFEEKQIIVFFTFGEKTHPTSVAFIVCLFVIVLVSLLGHIGSVLLCSRQAVQRDCVFVMV